LVNGSSTISDLFELPMDYRPRHYSALWQTLPPDWHEQLSQAVLRSSGIRTHAIFFRADDIGAGGRAFEALCRLFRHHEVPLAMAVVPGWMSGVRKSQLFREAPLDEPYWGWHQHGWRHVNWQRIGKKSEFGEQRPFEKQWRDVWQGQQKMKEIFGDRLVQVFTPPWNRLCNATMKILQELDFQGVSLASPLPRGAKPTIALKNLRIQLDLHTRKSKDGFADFGALLEELAGHLSKREPLGIMIHHQRMPYLAFEFLHELLFILKSQTRLRLLSFQEMLEHPHEE